MNSPARVLDAAAGRAAARHQDSLTKPVGALGRLEHCVVRLAAMQGRTRPRVDRVHIAVFAADHGVTAEAVSAYPQSVTAQMVKNFAAGGAAISVLARELGAELEVIDVGTATGDCDIAGVRSERIAAGTANFALDAAMSSTQLERALAVGRGAAERAREAGAELFIGGEMGIGNTTAAAALAAALLGEPAAKIAGRGAGLDAAGVAHKARVIERALARHADAGSDPLEWLRRVGGFEIAALTGAYVACAQHGLPVLIDGFISATAALAAERILPGAKNWFLYGHRSAELGGSRVLQALEGEPLLDLGMRLGEGSGAAVALAILRLATALHDQMATFAEAGVSGASGAEAINDGNHR